MLELCVATPQGHHKNLRPAVKDFAAYFTQPLTSSVRNLSASITHTCCASGSSPRTPSTHERRTTLLLRESTEGGSLECWRQEVDYLRPTDRHPTGKLVRRVHSLRSPK